MNKDKMSVKDFENRIRETFTDDDLIEINHFAHLVSHLYLFEFIEYQFGAAPLRSILSMFNNRIIEIESIEREE